MRDLDTRLTQDAPYEQPAVAMCGVFLAAHDRDRITLRPLLEALDALLESRGLSYLVIEHAVLYIVVAGGGRASAEFQPHGDVLEAAAGQRNGKGRTIELWGILGRGRGAHVHNYAYRMPGKQQQE